MRCEAMQMERMAGDDRFGEHAGARMRMMEDIRRRMRHERQREEESHEYEAVGDQQGD